MYQKGCDPFWLVSCLSTSRAHAVPACQSVHPSVRHRSRRRRRLVSGGDRKVASLQQSRGRLRAPGPCWALRAGRGWCGLGQGRASRGDRAQRRARQQRQRCRPFPGRAPVSPPLSTPGAGGWGERAVPGRGCRKGVALQEGGEAVLNSPEGRGVSSGPSLGKVEVAGAEDRQSPTAVAIIGIKGSWFSA